MPQRYLAVLFAFVFMFAAGCGVYDSITGNNMERANDPNLSQAHMERARFFWAQGEPNRTIQEMEWAIAADPYNFEAAYNLGLMYLDQGQRMSARRVWQNALLALDDGVERPYSNARARAELQAALAELDKAERPLGTPQSILLRQELAGGGQSHYLDSASESAIIPAPAPSETPLAQPGAAAAVGGSSASYPGLPASGQMVAQAPAASGAPVPQPYVPRAEDGKPAPRAANKPPQSANKPQPARTTQRPPECPPCAPQNTGKYAVLVSSNRQQKSAQADLNRLKAKGYNASIATNKTASGTWYVVWAGCCTSKEDAQKLALQLIKQGLSRDARAMVPQK